jgi:hypothetical protein
MHCSWRINDTVALKKTSRYLTTLFVRENPIQRYSQILTFTFSHTLTSTLLSHTLTSPSFLIYSPSSLIFYTHLPPPLSYSRLQTRSHNLISTLILHTLPSVLLHSSPLPSSFNHHTLFSFFISLPSALLLHSLPSVISLIHSFLYTLPSTLLLIHRYLSSSFHCTYTLLHHPPLYSPLLSSFK